MERREFAAALPYLSAACRAAPQEPSAHFLRGTCHHALGHLTDALAAFDAAAALQPANLDARHAGIAVLCQLDRVHDALRRCEQLTSEWPDNPDVRFNTGLVHEAAADPAAAIASYDDALARQPDHRQALLNRGFVLTRLGRLEEAYVNNRAAAEAYPQFADSHYNMAEVALALGRHADALEHCARALALDPRHLGALFDRALALAALRSFDESRAAWTAARAVDADAVDARWASVAGRNVPPRFSPETVYLSQVYARLRTCDWSERDGFVATVRELVDLRPGDLPTERALVFASTTLPCTARERVALARTVSGHIQRGVGPPLPGRTTTTAGPLRIAYLSPDFRNHVVGRLARSLLHYHDRGEVTAFAYSLSPDDGSEIRRGVAAAADRFRDLSALGHRAAAETIARDGIDILVDLAGYTDGARPEILALRPAPLQVTYLGFPGSTGADFIDYAFTDRVATPPGSECWWSEQLAFLPHTSFFYAAVEAPETGAITRERCGLPPDATVFCAFHGAHKIGPESLSAWLEVLRRTPDSVLWVLDGGPACGANLRGAMQAAGLDPRRLVEAAQEPLPRHLARLALADLFLDAFEYNAITGTCDALWMGLPVLTLTGIAPSARAATSLLTAAGLAALAVSERGAFIERAVGLARSPAVLGELRRRIRDTVRRGALFDAQERVRDIEAAYRRMAARAREGLPPASFELPGNGPP